jgi:hypothetical protein
LHQNDDNVAQSRGPKIRPKLGVSCRRLDWCVFFLVNYLQDGFTKIQTHAMK